jgi:arginase family enzyme
MIDPLTRWAQHGEKPDFTGLLSFAGQRYTEDPDELEGADVAIVGAATDDLVSDRPGTRLGPRAIRAAGCPPGRHLAAGIDAFAALRVIDIDVLDPSFAPGTGTPEPGGMDVAELMWAVRTLATELDLVGTEMVEVIPTAIGSADITALAADRFVRELLTGIALRREEGKR